MRKPILPTIGSYLMSGVNTKKARADKSYWLTISPAFIAMFLGLAESRGYIRVNSEHTTSRYQFGTLGKLKRQDLRTELVIRMPIEYFDLLHDIHSVLKIGSLRPAGDEVIYSISKIGLQEILFPLMKHHGMFFLTKPMREQYALALFVMENNVKAASGLADYRAPVLNEYSAGFLASQDFLRDYVVGYVMGLGVFFVDETGGEHRLIIPYRPYDGLYTVFSVLLLPAPVMSLRASHLYGDPELGKHIPDFVVRSDEGRARVIAFFKAPDRQPLMGPAKAQFEA